MTASGPLSIETYAWHVPRPEPSTIIVFMPTDDAPQQDRTVARLREQGASEPATTSAPAAPADIRWQHELILPADIGPAVVWCEAARPVQPGTFGDAAIESAPWIVGLQCMLSANAPAEDYAALLRVLTAALPETVGIYDHNANMCHPRAFIDDQIALDAPAATDWLYSISAIADTNPPNDSSNVWLRTVGMNRCSRPELEMLNVPYRHVHAAAKVVDLLCEQVFDGELPAPEHVFEIGADLSVMLHPLNACVQDLADDALGGGAMRAAMELDADRPTAVIDAEPAVLAAIDSGRAAVYRTTRATARQAALARARWPRFIETWNRLADDRAASSPPAFLIKAAVTPDAGHQVDREHLWFEVQSIEDHTAIATPVQNAAVASDITAGQPCRLDPQGISDWLIITAEGRFGPAQFQPTDDTGNGASS